MSTVFVAIASVPDGYSERRTNTFLVYDPSTLMTYEVYPHGHHIAYLPPVENVAEVRWLLHNHPAAKRRYSDIKEVRVLPRYPVDHRMIYRQLVGLLPDAGAEDLHRVAEWILDMIEDERDGARKEEI